MIRFLQRHRSIGHLISRGPIRSWISRRVWAELERDPVFIAAMAKGEADLRAGLFVPWRDVVGRTSFYRVRIVADTVDPRL